MAKRKLKEILPLTHDELKNYIEDNREFISLVLEKERERDRKTMERASQYWINP